MPLQRNLMNDPFGFIPRPFRRFLAGLYRLGVSFRLALYETGYRSRRQAPKPVISVGNLTWGGTGKTPLVEYIAHLLEGKGYKLSVISRGYGRRTSRPFLVSNGITLLSTNPRITGDEPLLLARRLPQAVVAVGADRFRVIQLVESSYPCDIYILDDAFQHLQLDRTIDLVLIDATDPFGDFALPPLGRLREPLGSLARASAVVVTRADRPFDQEHLERTIHTFAPKVPIFYSFHELTAIYNPITGETFPPQKLSGRRILVFCGIGNPQIFLEDLLHFQAHIPLFCPFPDHHPFSQREIVRLCNQAQAAQCEFMVTTEKDWVRIESLPPPLPLYIARIETRLENEAAFCHFLFSHLS